MLTEDAKIILVKKAYYEEDGGNLEVSEITSVQGLMTALGHNHYWMEVEVKALLKDETFVALLDQLGYKDMNKITKIDEKVKLGKTFYALANGCLRKIDITNPKVWAEELAKDSCIIAQEINKSCLKSLCPKLYTAYEKAKQAAEAKKEKNAVRMEAKRERLKQKQLEDAKYLLESQGLKVSK